MPNYFPTDCLLYLWVNSILGTVGTSLALHPCGPIFWLGQLFSLQGEKGKRGFFHSLIYSGHAWPQMVSNCRTNMMGSSIPKNIPPFWVFFDVGFPRTPFVVRSRFPFYWESDARTRIGGVTAAAGRGEGMKKSFDFFGSVWKEGGGGEDPDSIEEGRRSAMKKKKKGDPRGLQIICCDKGKKVLRCTLCLFS